MEAQGGEGKDALYSTDLLNCFFLLMDGEQYCSYQSTKKFGELPLDPLQVSYPLGKLHFSFTSSPTDTHNTVADSKYADMSIN
jgi:hypothetical protein